MANSYFQFKQFRIEQGNCAMKVTTEGCIFGTLTLVPEHTQRILDIGAGTGLLSLIKAQQSQYFQNPPQIDAVEIDESAFLQAHENFKNSPWKKQLSAFHTSLTDFQCDSPYDLIISNPPFFSNHMTSVDEQKNKAIHNQSLSPELLANSIDQMLSNSGKVSILYPAYEMENFTEIMRSLGFSVVTDLTILNGPNKPVFRKIREFSRNHSSLITEKTIAIRDQDGMYSSEIHQALSPFYLHL